MEQNQTIYNKINEMLEDGEWSKAAQLIEDAIEESNAEQKATLAYNLVVCYIKMKDSWLSQKALNKYGNLLSEEDRKQLQEEILKLPSKIKGEDVAAISWFKSDVKMNDVIGLKEVKKKIYEKIINPIKYESFYKEYGVKLSDGFIFYGPPGTGKTMLAKAIAGETGIRMLLVNLHEMVSKYQGQTTRNLHAIFQQARDGNPAIIFFDEIDSIAQSRNQSEISSTGGEERRIINTLLTELDGAMKENNGIYVIGATNRPQDIDPAIARSGRFNQFIYIRPPNLSERIALFKYYIGKLKKIGKIDYLKLGLASFGFSPADIAQACDSGAKHVLSLMAQGKEPQRPLATKDFLWAIKQMPKAPLVHNYRDILETFRKLDSEQRNQFADMKKDIIFYVRKAPKYRALYTLLSYVV